MIDFNRSGFHKTIELHQGTIEIYKGNYSAYMRQKDERNAVLRRTYEKQQDEMLV